MLSNRTTKYDKSGYVYLIRIPTGHYKIGHTKNLNQRIRHFTVTMPFDVELIHTIPCDDARDAEQRLHKLHKKEHVSGEWFQLSDADVAFLRCFLHWNADGSFVLHPAKHVAYLLKYWTPESKYDIDVYYGTLIAGKSGLILP